jgi:hypothetical protein
MRYEVYVGATFVVFALRKLWFLGNVDASYLKALFSKL